MTQEKKINIAELLKDCPNGMELDCILFENPVKYESSTEGGNYSISIRTEEGELFYLTKEGYIYDRVNSKCVIFPKGKTTWEGFQRPFKDGDIVAFDNPYRTCLEIFIFKDKKENNTLSACYLMFDGNELYLEEDMYYVTRLATEEEKEKLFQAIKDNGYKWNPETKTLEKLIVPKFKIGDAVKDKNNIVWFIVQVSEKHFDISSVPNAEGYFVPIEDQDNYELINDTKFKVGDRIKQIGSDRHYIIKNIEFDRYILNNNQFIRFTDEHIYELAPNKLVEPKFKDGDILYAMDEGKEFIFILKHIFKQGAVYCYLSLKGDDLRLQEVWLTDYNPTHRLATEEEKQKLFDAIKSKGYKWNAETKTLKKLNESNEDVDDEILMSDIYFDREYYADEVELHLDNYNLEIRDGIVYAVFKNQIK